MIRGYHLNSDSKNFIKKLVQRFEVLGYNTEISSNPNGSIFFTASKLGGVNNRFDFYAKPNGNIDSIAIYGSHLKGHLDNVLEKQTIFGLPIEDAEYACGYLAAIMAADGEIADAEIKLWQLVCTLGCFPTMNIGEALTFWKNN